VNSTFVRPQPPQACVIRQFAAHRAEVGHQIFNRYFGKQFAKRCDQTADDLVAIAQSENDSATRNAIRGDQPRDRERVLDHIVNSIRAGARFQIEPAVLRLNAQDRDGLHRR